MAGDAEPDEETDVHAGVVPEEGSFAARILRGKALREHHVDTGDVQAAAGEEEGEAHVEERERADGNAPATDDLQRHAPDEEIPVREEAATEVAAKEVQAVVERAEHAHQRRGHFHRELEMLRRVEDQRRVKDGEAERREDLNEEQHGCSLRSRGEKSFALVAEHAEVRAVATRLDGIGISSIRVLMPQEYNARYAGVHNVNVLLNEIYAGLLLELATASRAHTVILDKYGGRAMALWKSPQSFRFVVETHAERYPEVAAASVLARAAFLDGLERTARNSGVVRLPKGASMEAQAFMRRLASDKGKDVLRSVAKVNFAPVKECLESLF